VIGTESLSESRAKAEPKEPKDDDELKDQTSTGRKRARAIIQAELASGALYEDMECEWSGLKFAGGGAVPIVGCNGTLITFEKGNGGRTANIQHGPDKSTLNNDRDTNLHVICTNCHNHWHALNDPYYSDVRPEGGRPFIPLSGNTIPHDRETKASEFDLEMDANYWKLTSAQRKLVPYRGWDNE